MAAYISEIPLLPDERWWGGGGGDGQNQPYGAGDSARIDLRVHGNTSSPLPVSSCGRYVWSEKPFVRAMEYEFPRQGFARPMQQFMLGSRWLVAPVTTPDNAKTVELPAGTWRDDLGAIHEGPATLHLENVPLSRLPRYERLTAVP